MYSTKRQKVELICENSVMDAIIDKFSEEEQPYAYDLKSFKAEVNIAVSHVFFSWVFGFDGRVGIHSPKEVRTEYAEMVQKAYDNCVK